MLGAIAGDIIGSVYEARPIKKTEFPLFHPRCRFTDDTVLTVALADSLMHGAPFVGLLKQYYRAYPHAGYGGSFHKWAQSADSRPAVSAHPPVARPSAHAQSGLTPESLGLFAVSAFRVSSSGQPRLNPIR